MRTSSLKITVGLFTQLQHDTKRDIFLLPCGWLKKSKDGTKYEYVAIYVDDLLITCEDPSGFINTLKDKYTENQRSGPLEYHHGCDYHLDPDGTLVALPKKYISKILDSFTKMFLGETLPYMRSPLEKNNHPELNNSENDLT